MSEKMSVVAIGDEHRDRIWKDRHGNYWAWYDDGCSQGWKYEQPGERARFGGMHIPTSGPFTYVTDVVTPAIHDEPAAGLIDPREVCHCSKPQAVNTKQVCLCGRVIIV